MLLYTYPAACRWRSEVVGEQAGRNTEDVTLELPPGCTVQQADLWVQNGHETDVVTEPEDVPGDFAAVLGAYNVRHSAVCVVLSKGRHEALSLSALACHDMSRRFDGTLDHTENESCALGNTSCL